MCDLTAASYRHGTVITSSDANGVQKFLRVSQARRIGVAIQERLDEYMSAAVNCVETTSAELGDEFGFQSPSIDYDFKKLLSARFDPGLILDLPKLSITSEGRTIEVRTCLTVCVGATKSKLWTRANTLGDWGKITREELDRIHAYFDKACKLINVALLENYQRDFANEMEEDIDLATFGMINLFAADCAGRNVSANLEQLCDNIRDNHSVARTIDDVELANAMRDVTNISLEAPGQDASDTAGFSLSENAEFYPFRGINGAGSVFVKLTHGGEAYFSGIVNGDTDIQAEDPPIDRFYSNSVGTTAEIAAFFGAAF